ncbi:MAG TPA: 30S ribosome-binding factor RbfA [Acidimicrobiia bacterium]|nr:30S ribosome-binding factor RbfA [Acidimicrobiia bacterium]
MAHKSYSRVSRVNHLIQEVLAEEIELIDDDDLVMVTVTGCDVSPDLRHAKVFVSAFGDSDKRDRAISALQKNKGKLKRAMSASTRMKFLPELHFLADPSIDIGFKIEKIIKEVHDKDGQLALRGDHLADQD